jgi:hypothetical protein
MKETITDLKDLNLGDIIQLHEDSPYNSCTVRRINEDGSIQLWRPHVVCGDFSYTGGIHVSVGIEDFAISSGPVARIRRYGA